MTIQQIEERSQRLESRAATLEAELAQKTNIFLSILGVSVSLRVI